MKFKIIEGLNKDKIFEIKKIEPMADTFGKGLLFRITYLFDGREITNWGNAFDNLKLKELK